MSDSFSQYVSPPPRGTSQIPWDPAPTQQAECQISLLSTPPSATLLEAMPSDNRFITIPYSEYLCRCSLRGPPRFHADVHTRPPAPRPSYGCGLRRRCTFKCTGNPKGAKFVRISAHYPFEQRWKPSCPGQAQGQSPSRCEYAPARSRRLLPVSSPLTGLLRLTSPPIKR